MEKKNNNKNLTAKQQFSQNDNSEGLSLYQSSLNRISFSIILVLLNSQTIVLLQFWLKLDGHADIVRYFNRTLPLSAGKPRRGRGGLIRSPGEFFKTQMSISQIGVLFGRWLVSQLRKVFSALPSKFIKNYVEKRTPGTGKIDKLNAN